MSRRAAKRRSRAVRRLSRAGKVVAGGLVATVAVVAAVNAYTVLAAPPAGAPGR